MNRTRGAFLTVTLVCAAIASAAAQTDSEGLRPLCTDRPTKSTGTCTVDSGHFQLESDLFNATEDRSSGVDTDTYLYTNPTLKFGLNDRLDIEATIAPLVHVTARDRGTGVKSSETGLGDLFLHAKFNLLGSDGGDLAIAIAPSIKIPTAKAGLGNGAVEVGVIVPISYTLAANWNLTFDPEIDILKDQTGSGRHAGIVNLVALGYTLGEVTAAAEFWSDVSFDPTGAATQLSFDLGLSWIPGAEPNFQLDGGVNLGLNHLTPDWQGYLGASRRF